MVHHPKKTYAPFGVATKRFNKIGFHPHLDLTGAMKREITKAGPGTYNPHPVKCKGTPGISWKTKLECEEFSKYLGYWNAHRLYERDFYKSLRGPGANEINADIYKKSHFSVIPNTGLGTGERFLDRSDSIPPPGTYQRMEEICTLKTHQFSNVMPFEWDGFIDRFRSTDPQYLLAPNRYDINDGKGLDALLNKVVSLRGPYDLFTGSRDGSTIKNYFAPSKIETPEYGYIKPSDIEILLKHPLKKRCGKFSKAPRYSKKPTVRSMLNDLSLCYKDPNEPGPAQYNLSNYKSLFWGIELFRVLYMQATMVRQCVVCKKVDYSKPGLVFRRTTIKKRSLYPFDTSKVNARPPLEWKIFPGPGRYSPKAARCLKPKRPSWVFLSSGNRDLFRIIKYSEF